VAAVVAAAGFDTTTAGSGLTSVSSSFSCKSKIVGSNLRLAVCKV
jgi:hypothetical protein